MRIAILLLAAASVFANPFHKGASWEWRWLTDTDSNLGDVNLTPIFGVVIDSSFVPESSAVLWSLEFRPDSANNEWADTALLVTDFDGKNGRWLKRSIIFNLFEFRDVVGPCGSTCLTGLDSSEKAMEVGSGNVRYQLWNESLGLLSGVVSGWRRYDLIAKDGRSLLDWGVDNGRRLVLPSVGSNFRWEVDSMTWYKPCAAEYCTLSRSDNRFNLDWVFKERLADSSGWMRAEVVQTRMGIDTDWIVKSSIDLRWNPLLGTVVGGQDSLALKIAKSFWWDWRDSSISSGWIRRDSAFKYYLSEYRMKDWFSIRSSGELDSALFSVSRAGHMGDFSYSYSQRSLRLLQVDDSIVRKPSFTGIKPVPPRRVTGLGDLRELAMRYPAALVVVRDARGVSQTLRLDRFMEQRTAPRLGLRWLEVRLPDGSIRKGSMVL